MSYGKLILKTNKLSYKMYNNYNMTVNMNQQWIDMVFGIIIDDDSVEWSLFEQILSYIPNLNNPLTCGKFMGETYLRAACYENNYRMVKLLISNQHGLNVKDEIITPIYIGLFSKMD